MLITRILICYTLKLGMHYAFTSCIIARTEKLTHFIKFNSESWLGTNIR